MLITQAFQNLLSGDAGLESLVSTRIWPSRRPQNGECPAVVWGRLDSTVLAMTLDTDSGDWLMEDIFEVVSFAHGPGGYFSASNINDAVLQRLHRFQGTVSDGESPESTLTIQKIVHEKLSEHYSDELKQYATRSIYRVHSVRNQRS